MCDPWNLVRLLPATARSWHPDGQSCRMRALELEMALYISRVPTADNIADDPSRERYDLLRRMGAVRLPPHLSREFRNAQCWRALSIVERRIGYPSDSGM